MTLNKEQTESNQRVQGRVISGKDGEGLPKNMYKGPMDKDNWVGRIDCGRWGLGRARQSNGGDGDICN